MQLLLVFAVLIAILTVTFAVQNTAVVTIKFITWNFEGSLALALLIALGLGIVVSLLVSIPASIKKNRLISQLKKANSTFENTEKEISQDTDPENKPPLI
jgi:uncharacterized integral membrane protein